MEENCDIATKCAPEHQSDAPIQLPDTPGTRQSNFLVGLSCVDDTSTQLKTSHAAIPEKTPPRLMENVLIGNIATSEMPRKPLKQQQNGKHEEMLWRR